MDRIDRLARHGGGMMCPTKRLRGALARFAVGDAVVHLTGEASGTVLLRGHFTSLIPLDSELPTTPLL